MKSRLNLNFPPTKDDQLYQLVHVGSYYHSPDNRENFQVEVFFQLKGGTDYKKAIGNSVYKRAIHVHHFPMLTVGSLWDPSGRQVQSSHATITETRHLEISAPGKITKLKHVLPKYSGIFGFLQGHAWQDARESFYYEFQTGSERILIPCTEIARACYYRGTSLIDFFFSRAAIGSCCLPIQYPSASNGQTAKVVLVTSDFRGLEIHILAEMLLNPAFAREVRLSHSMLFSYLGSTKSEKGKLIQNFPDLPGITLVLNGVALNYGQYNIFVGCSVAGLKMPFSYQKLLYDFEHDQYNSRGDRVTGPSAGASDPTKLLIRFQQNDDQVIDSNLAGTSQYQNALKVCQLNDFFDLPLLERASTPFTQTSPNTRFFPHVPGFLSEHGGGSDLNIAKGKIGYEQPEFYQERDMEIMHYLDQVVREFNSRKGLRARLLTLSNTARSQDPKISLFKTVDTQAITRVYRLIIIELCWENRYSYFIQMLHKGRAGFIHSLTGSPISAAHIYDILGFLSETGFDWADLNQHHYLSQMEIHFERIFIYPRNKLPRVSSTVDICLDELNNFFFA